MLSSSFSSRCSPASCSANSWSYAEPSLTWLAERVEKDVPIRALERVFAVERLTGVLQKQGVPALFEPTAVVPLIGVGIAMVEFKNQPATLSNKIVVTDTTVPS